MFLFHHQLSFPSTRCLWSVAFHYYFSMGFPIDTLHQMFSPFAILLVSWPFLIGGTLSLCLIVPYSTYNPRGFVLSSFNFTSLRHQGLQRVESSKSCLSLAFILGLFSYLWVQFSVFGNLFRTVCMSLCLYSTYRITWHHPTNYTFCSIPPFFSVPLGRLVERYRAVEFLLCFCFSLF